MAGTITMSLTQRFDNSTHLPLSGGLIYFIQAGTTSTPQNAFIDSALTLPYANPLTLDSGGNIPQLFFADGVIKVRITNRLGVQQLVQDNIQVTGASSGGGGGGTVDPTTILSTGDMKLVYNTGVLTGFVRANGRTIGSATSGASERANLDTSALFAFLWNADANLAVSGGRGASAVADYAANKTIALPDFRGRAVAGLDDMGNAAAGRLTATYFGAAATVLGAAGGAESHTLTTAELAAHTHANTLNDPGHVHAYVQPVSFGASGSGAGISGGTTLANTNSNTTSISISNASAGSGSPHAIMSPAMLATIYLKL